MGLFVCDNCKCVENTALGQYWSRKTGIYPKPYEGKTLCSECASPEFTDGTSTGLGKWHNKFPKEHINDYLKKNPDSELKYYKV